MQCAVLRRGGAGAAATLVGLMGCPHQASLAAPSVAQAAQTRTLTVRILDESDESAVTRWARVTSRPRGIDCPGTCRASFARGSTVTLEGTPATGYAFARWGAVSGGAVACAENRQPTCSVTMRAGESGEEVTALVRPAAQLVALPAGAGTLRLSVGNRREVRCAPPRPIVELPPECRPRARTGATITVTAVPDPGATFVGWSDFACSPRSRTCTVKATGQRFLTAMFDPVSLTVVPAAFGDITVTPPGAVCATGTASCTFRYPPRTLVTLRRGRPAADPAQGFWTGACLGTTGETCQVRVIADSLVTAGAPLGSLPRGIEVTLEVARGGDKRGRITGRVVGGEQTFACPHRCVRGGIPLGRIVKLKAKAYRKSRFKRWSDHVTKRERTVTAGQRTTIRAIFVKRR